MKLKIFKTIGIAALTLAATGCDSVLNTTPTNMLTDATVWNSKEAVEAYLANIYNAIQMEDFGFQAGAECQYLSQLTDEATRSYSWGSANNELIPTGVVGWWGYSAIRNVNSFLRDLQRAPLSDKERQQIEGEARFCRAFNYFNMVKRYGGVPILTVPQEYNGNIDSLQVPRNTEAEVYDFVRQECEAAAKLLPESRGNSERYRATKWAAYALECRAMLYAASEAKYGNVQLNGLVGIDANKADSYYAAAKTAAQAIINSGTFSLYKVYEDKAENFQNIFLDESSANTEKIFSKGFNGNSKGHSFDYYNAPQSFKVDYGCVTNPTEDFVAEFEYIDGSDGALKVNDEQGKPIKFSNPYDLFKNKDPRLLASVLVPFAPWQGSYVEVRKGIIGTDGNITTGSNLTDTYEGSNVSIAGRDGITNSGDVTKTGFYIKKFMNPTTQVDYGRSDNDWIVFRYAEVLLNYAEACIETGDEAEALKAVNEIRSRAGIALRTSVTRDQVRHERKVELAFENHRWWDIRRWHIADQILNARRFYALNPYLVWENGKDGSQMKYIFKVELAPKNSRTFRPVLYYEPIPENAILTNPKLVQNPGY